MSAFKLSKKQIELSNLGLVILETKYFEKIKPDYLSNLYSNGNTTIYKTIYLNIPKEEFKVGATYWNDFKSAEESPTSGIIPIILYSILDAIYHSYQYKPLKKKKKSKKSKKKTADGDDGDDDEAEDEDDETEEEQNIRYEEIVEQKQKTFTHQYIEELIDKFGNFVGYRFIFHVIDKDFNLTDRLFMLFKNYKKEMIKRNLAKIKEKSSNINASGFTFLNTFEHCKSIETYKQFCETYLHRYLNISEQDYKSIDLQNTRKERIEITRLNKEVAFMQFMKDIISPTQTNLSCYYNDITETRTFSKFPFLDKVGKVHTIFTRPSLFSQLPLPHCLREKIAGYSRDEPITESLIMSAMTGNELEKLKYQQSEELKKILYNITFNKEVSKVYNIIHLINEKSIVLKDGIFNPIETTDDEILESRNVFLRERKKNTILFENLETKYPNKSDPNYFKEKRLLIIDCAKRFQDHFFYSSDVSSTVKLSREAFLKNPPERQWPEAKLTGCKNLGPFGFIIAKLLDFFSAILDAQHNQKIQMIAFFVRFNAFVYHETKFELGLNLGLAGDGALGKSRILQILEEFSIPNSIKITSDVTPKAFITNKNHDDMCFVISEANKGLIGTNPINRNGSSLSNSNYTENTVCTLLKDLLTSHVGSAEFFKSVQGTGDRTTDRCLSSFQSNIMFATNLVIKDADPAFLSRILMLLVPEIDENVSSGKRVVDVVSKINKASFSDQLAKEDERLFNFYVLYVWKQYQANVYGTGLTMDMSNLLIKKILDELQKTTHIYTGKKRYREIITSFATVIQVYYAVVVSTATEIAQKYCYDNKTKKMKPWNPDIIHEQTIRFLYGTKEVTTYALMSLDNLFTPTATDQIIKDAAVTLCKFPENITAENLRNKEHEIKWRKVLNKETGREENDPEYVEITGRDKIDIYQKIKDSMKGGTSSINNIQKCLDDMTFIKMKGLNIKSFDELIKEICPPPKSKLDQEIIDDLDLLNINVDEETPEFDDNEEKKEEEEERKKKEKEKEEEKKDKKLKPAIRIEKCLYIVSNDTNDPYYNLNQNKKSKQKERVCISTVYLKRIMDKAESQEKIDCGEYGFVYKSPPTLMQQAIEKVLNYDSLGLFEDDTLTHFKSIKDYTETIITPYNVNSFIYNSEKDTRKNKKLIKKDIVINFWDVVDVMKLKRDPNNKLVFSLIGQTKPTERIALRHLRSRINEDCQKTNTQDESIRNASGIVIDRDVDLFSMEIHNKKLGIREGEYYPTYPYALNRLLNGLQKGILEKDKVVYPDDSVKFEVENTILNLESEMSKLYDSSKYINYASYFSDSNPNTEIMQNNEDSNSGSNGSKKRRWNVLEERNFIDEFYENENENTNTNTNTSMSTSSFFSPTFVPFSSSTTSFSKTNILEEDDLSFEEDDNNDSRGNIQSNKRLRKEIMDITEGDSNTSDSNPDLNLRASNSSHYIFDESTSVGEF